MGLLALAAMAAATPGSRRSEGLARDDGHRLIARGGRSSCSICHQFEPLFSHPVGVVPSMSVPSDLPLSRGRMTCTTCHEEGDCRSPAGGATGRPGLRNALTATELCARCHDPSDTGRSHLHGAALDRAHLAWPENLSAHSGTRILADGAFDMAMCCEGLEHFPDEIYQLARSEIMRVSKRYVLISVPFREDLVANTTKCGACAHVFHKWGHVRRFTMRTLETLLPGGALEHIEFFGKSQPFRFDIVKKINQKYGNAYAEPSTLTVCPACNEKSYEQPKRNLAARAMNAVDHLTQALVPTGSKHWSVALYRKL